MDSLLVLISSSGISSMSLSQCPGWLKCCGTASSVLFCIGLRCSPNLSLKARLVCPMYSIGVFVLHLRHWIMLNEIFRSTCYHLLDEVSLASVFECTWWYTVFNEGASFASDGVAFLYGRCVWSKCLWLTFDRNLSCEQAPKWSRAKRKLASQARPGVFFCPPGHGNFFCRPAPFG